MKHNVPVSLVVWKYTPIVIGVGVGSEVIGSSGAAVSSEPSSGFIACFRVLTTVATPLLYVARVHIVLTTDKRVDLLHFLPLTFKVIVVSRAFERRLDRKGGSKEASHYHGRSRGVLSTGCPGREMMDRQADRQTSSSNGML